MDATIMAGAAGAILALLFGYVPGLKDWYDNLESVAKRLVMLAALAVVALGSFGLSCAGWFNLPVTCDQAGVEQLLGAFLTALVANQTTYLISSKSIGK
jgi:hypothetical protein